MLKKYLLILSLITISFCATTFATSSQKQEEKNNLVLIKGDTFTMGSPVNEPEREKDEVEHNVTVSDFYMSEKELSQEEYEEVMSINPSENKNKNLPVTNVSWYDAINFCNALSKKNNLTPCYTITGNKVIWDKSANGYRLPTEAEWEYASRSKTNTPFSFGNYVNDTDANCYNAYGYNNDASGNWVNNYLQHTVNVDSYNKNAFGLYNMHGNAAEWVWDWYDEYDKNDNINPTGKSTGHYKIVRGGGYNDFPKHIRSAYRSAVPIDTTLYSIGIRLVRSAVYENKKVESIYENKNTKPNKILLAYFSQTNNTKGLAEIIESMTNVDVFRIERKSSYNSNRNGVALYSAALTELRNEELPELKEYLEDKGLNINDYDTILLGYCNWWASLPAPMRSFLNKYDLSNKTIIPFCSMGGGRFGQTISHIAKFAKNSTIKKGLDVTYSSYDNERIKAWLTENEIIKNNLENTNKGNDQVLKIAIGNSILNATLVDNSSTKALKELLSKNPLTIDMVDYANFEKYGDIGQTLPRNDENITTTFGDLILYQGNTFVIYYDTNTYNFTRLGKINDITQEQLKNILGNGNVKATLSIE